MREVPFDAPWWQIYESICNLFTYKMAVFCFIIQDTLDLKARELSCLDIVDIWVLISKT